MNNEQGTRNKEQETRNKKQETRNHEPSTTTAMQFNKPDDTIKIAAAFWPLLASFDHF